MSNTIRILRRQGITRQSACIRRFTTSTIARDENPSRSSSQIFEETPSIVSSSSGEVSRDMSSTAESSRSANPSVSGQSPNATNEDQQYAEIFANLNEQWPKFNTNTKPKPTKANHPPKPESIASRLTFDGFSTPSPRQRGVHSRYRRSAGSTPKEAETFNEILAGIFADLNYGSSPKSFSRTSSTDEEYGDKRGIGLNDPYSATQSGLGGFGWKFGLNKSNSGAIKNRARNLRSHFVDLEKDDQDEKDLEFLEELELLKEEMEVISSDVELIEWSRNRVFKPLTNIPISTNTPERKDTLTGSTIISYPPTYPKILAHLLRTLRVNYNSPHLVLSLFNYAQNISLESYLSGCLTEVYNEVLLTRWESFRDLKGVEQGIREMEIMGVNWDQITARLVSKIVEEISKDLLSSSSASPHGVTYGKDEDSTETEGGFSNLASLTTTPQTQNELFKKYGKNVMDRLQRLDEKVSKDVRKQEKMYEIHQRRKRKLRDERERKMERTLRESRPREEEEGEDGEGNRRVGYIEEPKEGERAYI
nr:hypothetical protein I302_06062 [Kwoniella bestiolae CBS 10118]OCF24601.1 hypothetical protein I302_06062 [Kwoniella bestiolae CBS 10118]